MKFITGKNNIKRRFFSSLKRGTGEAYLIVKNNPNIDFSKFIIKGALINYAYDGQSENSRANYIYSIIKNSRKMDRIINTIYKGLKNENKDTWSLTHLFDLAKILAQNGDKHAKKIIYERFFTNRIEYSDWVGYEQILELDGLDGLFFIADKIGNSLLQNPNDIQDSMIINHFQDDNPNLNVMELLENKSKSNENIKRYLDNVKKTEQNLAEYKSPIYDYDALKNEIENDRRVFNIRPYLRGLTEQQIIEISDNFLKEQNIHKKIKYLSIFGRIKFPYDPKIILNYANNNSKTNKLLKDNAIDALKLLKSEEIRNFALSNIVKSKDPSSFCNILVSNYKKGDYKILASIVKKNNNEFNIENLAISYCYIYKKNKTQECLVPLLELYKKLTCGIHRSSIIRILVDNNVLPNYINEEIKYDSYEETRKLYRNK